MDTSSETTPTAVFHNMSCAHCGHGLHIYLECRDRCDCAPQLVPGAAAPSTRPANPMRVSENRAEKPHVAPLCVKPRL